MERAEQYATSWTPKGQKKAEEKGRRREGKGCGVRRAEKVGEGKERSQPMSERGEREMSAKVEERDP